MSFLASVNNVNHTKCIAVLNGDCKSNSHKVFDASTFDNKLLIILLVSWMLGHTNLSIETKQITVNKNIGLWHMICQF